MKLFDKEVQALASNLEATSRVALNEILNFPLGEIRELESEEAVFGLNLSKTMTDPKLEGAWIFSHVLDLKLGPTTLVGHWGGSSFVSLGQFSLSSVSARTLFVAQGERAIEALETVISSQKSFDPRDFDRDGYFVGKSSK